jgi:hypothetical protein
MPLHLTLGNLLATQTLPLCNPGITEKRRWKSRRSTELIWPDCPGPLWCPTSGCHRRPAPIELTFTNRTDCEMAKFRACHARLLHLTQTVGIWPKALENHPPACIAVCTGIIAGCYAVLACTIDLSIYSGRKADCSGWAWRSAADFMPCTRTGVVSQL